MNPNKELLFTEEEYKVLICRACDCDGGATQEQVAAFITECEEAKIGSLMLEATVSGHLKVQGYEGDKPLFVPCENPESTEKIRRRIASLQ